MNIFISYATIDREVAERLYLSLTGDGHEVFFDRTGLPAGASFDDRIRDAVRGCDLFVFLISPDALKEGSYALTELELAKERWEHPSGWVLPVMVRAVLLEQIPAYLQAVTILEPKGNLTAEVASAAATLEGIKRKVKQRRRAVLILIALGALAGIAVAVFDIPSDEDQTLSITVDQVERNMRGFGEVGNVYRVTATFRNPTATPMFIVGIDAELEDTASRLVAAGAVDREDLELSPGQSTQWNGAFTIVRSSDGRALAESEIPETRWRLCARLADGRTCTGWLSWTPVGKFDRPPLVPIRDAMRKRARVVSSFGFGFLVGLARPNELVALDRDGRFVRQCALPGEPAALDARSGVAIVGVKVPNAVAVVDLDPFKLRWSSPVKEFLFGDPDKDPFLLSSEPEEVLLGPSGIWLATAEGAGDPAILLLPSSKAGELPAADTEWILPQWDEASDVSGEGLRLRLLHGQVYGVDTAVSPASFYRLEREKTVDYSGHNYTFVSCANDLLAAEGGNLLLRSCDEEMLEVGNLHGRLQVVAHRGQLRVPGEPQSDMWSEHLLAWDGDAIVIAATLGSLGSLTPLRSGAVRLSPEREQQLLLDLPDFEVLSLAANDGTIAIVLRSPKRDHELVLIAAH